MNCPHCGSYQVRTVDTRAYDTEVRRRRECTDCMERFNTIEIPLEEYKGLKQMEQGLRVFKAQILALVHRYVK